MELATHSSKRYQGLILSIVALLALIFILLVFTFYSSNILERNAVLMNESNRVANSAEEVIKDLFDLQNSIGEDPNSPHLKTVHERLKVNSEEMTKTLALLRDGGVFVDSRGKKVTLPAASSATAVQSLKSAQGEWDLLKPKINHYLKDAMNIMVDSSDDLTQASLQAKTSSLNIDTSLQELVDSTAASTSRQASTIRLVQLIGVAAILAYFAIFIFFFLKRLRQADEQLLAAQRETEEIMQTVDTGLFLLDKDLSIGNQHSKALTAIIGSDKVAGRPLEEVLRNRISDKDLQTAEEFVGQLYNPRVKEKLIHDLNPLHKVMIHDGDKGSRYLDFKFSRVYEGKDIARILVNVNDISEAVRLEQRLEKERSQSDLQIEMLTTILNVKPAVINEFIKNTQERIDKMNNVLKNPGSSQFELENKLKAFYREMHSLKGEASALRLHSFTKIASDAEDKLHTLQNQDKLAGNDFLPLTVQLDELLSLANTISGLSERINEKQPSAASRSQPNQPQTEDDLQFETVEPMISVDGETGDNQDFAQYLVQFGEDIAKRQNKQITVDVSKMTAVIPDALRGITKEVCIQLLRNSIVHGIADSQTRLNMGKDSVGRVSIAMDYDNTADGCFVFVVEDDGQGIDYDAIREKLIMSGKPYDKVAQMDKTQLLNTIFSSGFSTKAYADEDGGRGVGLDIVKDKVKEYDGKIKVQSEKGKFTRFVIKLPIPTA